ncbi:MAG: ABC transporter permease [Prevotella sp.]
MRFCHSIIQGLKDICQIWLDEMRNVVRDEGVLIFFIVVPLAYPLLYSWIYNNEVVHEVPVVVVDQSKSAESREFIRLADASPDVEVSCYAGSIDEAKRIMARGDAFGIYVIPEDFGKRINSMRQTAIAVYCDMSLMLAYKAIYQTSVNVTTHMNEGIQVRLAGNTTNRQDDITTHPLEFEEVPIFNPTSGYGSFIIPGVLMLIIQQTLVLGIGLSAGTARERNKFKELVPISRHYQGYYRIVLGKSLCYFMIYSVMAAYLTLVVPRLFSFTSLPNAASLIAIMLPYLLACIFFGITVSCMVRYRENVILLVVFMSVPLLFVSGVSWPQSNIPAVWECLSWLFPSTFGIRSFVRVNTMGAELGDVVNEYRALWIQATVYFFIACGVYRFQIMQTRSRALFRLRELKRKRKG